MKKKILIATHTKLIFGTHAHRLWVETDEEHQDVAKLFTGMVQQNRRCVVPETRYPACEPLVLPEPPKPEGVSDVEVPRSVEPVEASAYFQPGGSVEDLVGTPVRAPRPSILAGIKGVHVSDDYPESEEDEG